MEVQKLFVTLALDAANFKQGLSDAVDQAKSFGGRVGGALSKVGTIATGAFLGIGAAAVGGFGLAMNAAIDMNAGLETSTMQFTTLMGSADEAAAHVQNLFDFAASTPYESQEIINASLKLQTFGGAALNTMENLTLVGDAAAAVSAPIDEVSFWIGRLYSNLQGGQPFGEAAMRLQELGIMTPAARTELEAMQEAGVNGTEIFGAFQERLGAFTGAMEKQAGTWRGLLSTIKDNLMMAAAEGLKPFFDLAKQGLTALSAWLASPEVQQGIQRIAQGFADLIQRVGQFVTEQVIPFVQTHGQQLKEVLIALGAAFAGLAIIGTIVALVTALTNPIVLIAGLIGVLAAAWTSNWGGIRDKTLAAWEAVRPIFEAIRDWLAVHIPPVIEALRAMWVDHVWPAIQNAIAIVWPIIQGIFTAIVTFITGVLIPAIQFLWRVWTEEVWPVIQTVTENVWTVVKSIFEEVGRWINDNLVPWIQFLHDVWVNVVWPAIRAAIENAWKVIEPIWTAIRDWAEKTLPPVINALQTIFENVMGGIRAAIQPVKDMWDSLVGAVKGFWDWISNRVFNFQINLPDLPDWATPGSPLPIHTAWMAFAEDMRKVDWGESIGKAMTPAALSPALTMASGSPNVDNSKRSVNYGGYHVHISTQGDSDTALKAIWKGLQ